MGYLSKTGLDRFLSKLKTLFASKTLTGELEDLNTTNKTNLVAAINENKSDISRILAHGIIDDYNSATEIGTYAAITSTINGPIQGYCIVTVSKNTDGNWILQTATDVETSIQYIRFFNDAWSAWVVHPPITSGPSTILGTFGNYVPGTGTLVSLPYQFANLYNFSISKVSVFGDGTNYASEASIYRRNKSSVDILCTGDHHGMAVEIAIDASF